MITKPEPIKYETKYGTMVLSDGKQLGYYNGRPVVRCGEVTYKGVTRKLIVAYDDKPDLALMIEQWKAAWDAWKYRNVPGLNELRKAQDAAYDEQARYDAEFNRMMDTGSGIAPKPVDKSLAEKAKELAQKYPRAALYLVAERYTFAANHHKYSAGKDAMDLIAEGGSLGDAKSILDNWLPESAMWD